MIFFKWVLSLDQPHLNEIEILLIWSVLCFYFWQFHTYAKSVEPLGLLSTKLQ